MRGLDARPLEIHVWLQGPDGCTSCAVVRQQELIQLAGKAGLAARVEGFGEYLDRRGRPTESRSVVQWACTAAGLPADALDGPLAADVQAALELFDVVLLQRMPEAPGRPVGERSPEQVILPQKMAACARVGWTMAMERQAAGLECLRAVCE